MKTAAISILIIFISVVSGWIWSYIFLGEIHSGDISYTTSNNENQFFPAISLSNTGEGRIWTLNLDLNSLEDILVANSQALTQSVVSIVISRDIMTYRRDPWWFFEWQSWTVRQQVWWGSGFFIREDGLILTNRHVVQDTRSEYTVILSDGREFETEVVALDPLNDLAVIRIDGNWERFQVPHIIDSQDKTRIWSFAIAIGNALAEFQNSVSLGIVSGKNRTINAQWTLLSNLIQTDAAINPWNSGWPLINLNWEIIWINTAIAWRTSGIGFAISLTQSRIDFIIESVENHWEIRRPFIGINYIANSPAVAREFSLPVNYWAFIVNDSWSIVPWSSAERSGLQPGDLITHINDRRIIRLQDLASVLQNSLPWDILRLRILRSGETIDVSLELWSM